MLLQLLFIHCSMICIGEPGKNEYMKDFSHSRKTNHYFENTAVIMNTYESKNPIKKYSIINIENNKRKKIERKDYWER